MIARLNFEPFEPPRWIVVIVGVPTGAFGRAFGGEDGGASPMRMAMMFSPVVSKTF
jgi:hypothetical protein